MQLLKVSLGILGIVLGMTLINSFGIMDAYRTPDIEDIDTDTSLDITRIDEDAPESDVTNQFFGWKSVVSALGTIWVILELVFLPGPYITANGGNAVIAACVQAVFNAVFVIGIYQLWTKFGLRGTY